MAIPSAPLVAARSDAAPRPSAPATVIEGKVGKSDTLGRLLKKSGLSAAESDEIIRALSGVLDFGRFAPVRRFASSAAADGRVKRFELDLSKGHHVRAERQPSGELRADAA